LWSAKADFVDDRGEILKKDSFRHIALVSPKLVPYGAAAVEVIEKLGLMGALRPKFVQGENIAQTYQFVSTGNAELGFVALSQVYRDGKLQSGSGWIVPSGLHAPIRQDAVVLARAKNNPAARALAGFLRGDAALKIIAAYGYGHE
jgi:molybdate transport system substrate-binding protein